MAYSDTINTRQFPLVRLFKKLGKVLAKSFPLNSVRILGLKMCGFEVGKQVYIGPGLIIASYLSNDLCSLVIGDRVAIGPRVTLVLSSDSNWSNLNKIVPPVSGKIKLNNDCWLGTGAIILPNITVSEMSIVAAGAVVTKDVPPYSVVAGVPAKIIKKVIDNI